MKRGPYASAAPPFPLAARLMADRAFPLPLLGLVHTSAEIRQWRPLSTEDALELTVYAERLRPHRRGTVIATEARRDGALLTEALGPAEQ
ncbi:hypothetical protein [Streptomyces sp. 8N706]|uniref:hypothetical protein n=1 Tax=Streptomyces sp. 8N706 TaxID=3457416 RepID=UPI003FD281F5